MDRAAIMAVIYHTNLTEDGAAALDSWVHTHAYDAIDHIDIHQHFVTMHGRNRDSDDTTVTATRSGDLFADLDEAFKRLWRA